LYKFKINTPGSRVRTAHRAPSTPKRNSHLLYLHCTFGREEFEATEAGKFKAGRWQILGDRAAQI